MITAAIADTKNTQHINTDGYRQAVSLHNLCQYLIILTVKVGGFPSHLNGISCILIGAHCLLSFHWTGMKTAREPEMKTAIQKEL